MATAHQTCVQRSDNAAHETVVQPLHAMLISEHSKAVAKLGPLGAKRDALSRWQFARREELYCREATVSVQRRPRQTSNFLGVSHTIGNTLRAVTSLNPSCVPETRGSSDQRTRGL